MSKMFWLLMLISPMTAPAASSSAKEGIFRSAGGSCAAAGPSEQVMTAQQATSKRDREGKWRRKIRTREIGRAERAGRAAARPIVRAMKRPRQITVAGDDAGGRASRVQQGVGADLMLQGAGMLECIERQFRAARRGLPAGVPCPMKGLQRSHFP